MEILKGNIVGTVEAARKIGISCERLRYWERLGVVEPEHIQCGTRKFRRYSQDDIYRAVLIKTFVDVKKYTLERAIKTLKEDIGEY